MKKIGLLGGSFDPIHGGHLNLAFELMEKKALDEVWFIPANLSPHKTEAFPASSQHRLEMVRLAIQDIPQFQVKDLELKRPAPSYTLDTLIALLEEAKTTPSPPQFYLLLGEDSVRSFSRWHRPEDIVNLVPLLIGLRSGNIEKPLHQGQAIQEAIQKGLVQTRLLDISSTDLRQRLSQGLYCAHLLPLPVLHYIEQQQLYKIQRTC